MFPSSACHFPRFLPRVRRIADEPQNQHVDWIFGIGLDGQGVPSASIIQQVGKIHGAAVVHLDGLEFLLDLNGGWTTAQDAQDGFWRVLVSWTTARREREVCRYSWVDEKFEVRSRLSMLLAKCRNDDVSFLQEVCVCCGISLCIHVILDGENTCRHSHSMRKRSKESRTVCSRCPNGPHEGGTPPKNPKIAPESQLLFLCLF